MGWAMRSAVGYLSSKSQHPGGGDVLGQGGQFGEDTGQEVVQSIDGLRRLLDLGLQAAGDFAQQDHLPWRKRGVASGCSTTAKRAMAWLSVSSVVRLGKWAF